MRNGAVVAGLVVAVAVSACGGGRPDVPQSEPTPLLSDSPSFSGDARPTVTIEHGGEVIEVRVGDSPSSVSPFSALDRAAAVLNQGGTLVRGMIERRGDQGSRDLVLRVTAILVRGDESPDIGEIVDWSLTPSDLAVFEPVLAGGALRADVVLSRSGEFVTAGLFDESADRYIEAGYTALGLGLSANRLHSVPALVAPPLCGAGDDREPAEHDDILRAFFDASEARAEAEAVADRADQASTIADSLVDGVDSITGLAVPVNEYDIYRQLAAGVGPDGLTVRHTLPIQVSTDGLKPSEIVVFTGQEDGRLLGWLAPSSRPVTAYVGSLNHGETMQAWVVGSSALTGCRTPDDYAQQARVAGRKAADISFDQAAGSSRAAVDIDTGMVSDFSELDGEQ